MGTSESSTIAFSNEFDRLPSSQEPLYVIEIVDVGKYVYVAYSWRSQSNHCYYSGQESRIRGMVLKTKNCEKTLFLEIELFV